MSRISHDRPERGTAPLKSDRDFFGAAPKLLGHHFGVGRGGASFVVMAAFACGSCTGSRAGGGEDAEVTVARFCEGLPTVPGPGALAAPYATFDDGSGDVCVLTEGNSMGTACPAGIPSATIELGCPWTSVLFDMQQRPYFKRELHVQSAYAGLGWAGQAQHGRVIEMVIDNTEGSTITGHYRAEFPVAGQFPAVQARGAFSMCAAIGESIDPCRQR